MAWKIEFHPKAEEELKNMSASLQKSFLRVFDKIIQTGLLSLSSKLSKHIEGNIWELRATGKDGIGRSLYITRSGEVIKILVAFVKKTEKTPRDKIELAHKRSDE